ncbi:MAG: AAA family ATPase, partial [Duncaniella sp.]|nr:AAA family ATPase [Duncaniella sp.]
MKRSLYAKLLEWKASSSRKPLVLEGARQVGKTWLLKEFGNNEYENMIYINCDN